MRKRLDSSRLGADERASSSNHVVPSGSRLGLYEILSILGAGGMGEVYRARDSRPDRLVAVKVPPEVFVQDADRLARFEREAKAVAASSGFRP